MSPNQDDIQQAILCLQQGKVILYPTDTIWGLGCSAAFPNALKRIFEIKKRPTEKSVILLVDSIKMLKQYIESIHPRIETLMGFHDKPLTVIYPKAKNLDPSIPSLNGSIAIRVCKDPFCQELIKGIQYPLVSTSANESQMPYPVNFNTIASEIINSVDYVVKYRQSDHTVSNPSIIISYDEEGELNFIRK